MSRSLRFDKQFKSVTVFEHVQEIGNQLFHNSNTCSICIVNGSQYSKDVRAALKERGLKNA